MRRHWWVVVLVTLVLVFIGATIIRRPRVQASSPRPGGRGGMAGLPVPVAAVPVAVRDLPVYLRGLGSVSAFNTVTLKSRVDGQLVEVNFREGQEVKQGDLLAVIDPRPYQVMLHQTEATLAKDQAQLTDAKLNLQRYSGLYAQKIIPQQQVDTQRALADQLAATVDADKAQVENAKLQLTYSRITAPISGRIGLRLVDPGNIVHASDSNGLLVITQMQPISVVFTLPEDNIPAILAQMRNRTLEVEAYSRDDSTRIAAGKLVTIDNQIDPTTGTAKLKAVFDNADRQLWPNEFVNIRLLLDTQKNALTMPTAAVQRGNQGSFAFVVEPDDTVQVKPVKLGVTEGNLVAVEEGLKAGDMVVTDGQDRLQPNSRVEVRQPDGAAVEGRGPRNGRGRGNRGAAGDNAGQTSAPGNRQVPTGDDAGQAPGNRRGPGGGAQAPGQHRRPASNLSTAS